MPSKNNCSVVAAGIINPITGQRLTKTWMAEELFGYAKAFFQDLESKSGCRFWIEKQIVRPANDIEQLNDALSRQTDGFLGDYFSYEEKNQELDNIMHQKHGYFQIKHGGNLDVNAFLTYTQTYLKSVNAWKELWVEPEKIGYFDDKITVCGLETKNIIWCTGNYQANTIPFNYLPFSITKGEMLRIESDTISPNFLYNKNAFVVHQKRNEYVTGATFTRDLSETLTTDGKNMVLEKINDMIKVPYSITEHYFGLRPTVVDRKPLIGKHFNLENTFIFNGLGAKGVTQAPYFAKEFVNFILDKSKLTKEVDIERVHKKQKHK